LFIVATNVSTLTATETGVNIRIYIRAGFTPLQMD